METSGIFSLPIKIDSKGGEQMVKNRLKEFRESKGMTQEMLAEKAGLSRQTISKIENNEEVSVNAKTIVKISEVFGVSPGDIFLF